MSITPLTKEDFLLKVRENYGFLIEPAEIESLWSFDLLLTPEEVWPYLIDTFRFNRELDLAPRNEVEKDGKNHVTTTLFGLKQEWVEEPWSWVYEAALTVSRRYSQGVARNLQGVYTVEPLNEGNKKSRVYIYFAWVPKNIFWKFVLRASESLVRRKFLDVFKKIEANFKQKNKAQIFQKKNSEILPEQSNRLQTLQSQLMKKNVDREVLNKFSDYMLTADELDLDQIRVLKLASEWNIDFRKILLICLHGSRIGYVNIAWNTVCPHCKGARDQAKSLGDIPTTSYCESCDIKFGTDQADSIEVVFSPHSSIRKVSGATYCVAEPAKKEHIKIQKLLAGGESFSFTIPLSKALCRIRMGSRSTVVNVSETIGSPDFILKDSVDWPEQINLKPGAKVQIHSSATQTLVFEELRKQDLTLRPEHLVFFPEFRELFAEEYLKSDVKLHLGDQALLFTDIVGSTLFYERVGDAKAFSQVRQHFSDVFSIIKSHGGQVVKTIGDAVMGVFPHIENAYQASCEIQKKFATGLHPDIRLRISLHHGVVIGVQLENGFDYFGSVINTCAKIQSLAGAQEIALPSEVFQELSESHLQMAKSVQDKLYAAGSEREMAIKVVRVE